MRRPGNDQERWTDTTETVSVFVCVLSESDCVCAVLAPSDVLLRYCRDTRDAYWIRASEFSL